MQPNDDVTSVASGPLRRCRQGLPWLLLIATALLAACGQKGPLELPLPARPPATAAVPPPPTLTAPAAAASAPSPSR